MLGSGDFGNYPRSIQWGNPKSLPAYGHPRLQHGSHIPLQSLKDRASALNTPQGQFYDDMTIVDAEKKALKPRGSYLAPYPIGIGRVVHPERTVTENVTKVLVMRKQDGTVRTSYPITDQYAEDLINRGKVILVQIQ
ncbi:hypothetical protein HYR99_20400 [Candidatus Poribacteria bacterium]|nr:hypothetical protein [Candidatus Poribacteria bacterium]